MRSPKQNAHKLTLILDGIWMRGDRDECSIKHIGHGLAALEAGLPWWDMVDYATPWVPVERDEFPNLYDWERARRQVIAQRWAKVQALRDELGIDGFASVVRMTKFASIADRMAVDYPRVAS